jgi:hypothetical protein
VVSWGYRLIYDPSILNYHHVRASRLTQEYFKTWYYWQGLSDAVMLNIEQPLGALARVRLAASKLSWVTPRVLLMCMARSSARSFQRQCQIVEVWGLITGLFRSERQGDEA